MSTLRICKVDKKKYRYCSTCYDDRLKPIWMTTFCCERCKTIFDTLVKQTTKKITTDEAKKRLYDLDLNDMENFDDSIKEHINKVLCSDSDSEKEINESEQDSKEIKPTLASRKQKK